MNEEWRKLNPEEATRVLAGAGAVLRPPEFTQGETTLRAQGTPFWRGHDIVEITNLSTVPPARKYVIRGPDGVRAIDWSNRPVYETNESAPLRLDARTVVDYVRFFFSFVRGRHGRFLIIETIDDVRWQSDPPLQGRKVMQDMLEPISVIATAGDGGFVLSAFMLFKDSLFRTKINVRADGVISMSDEELKIEGMPVLQDSAA